MRPWLLLILVALLASGAWMALKALRAEKLAKLFLKGKPERVQPPADLSQLGFRPVAFTTSDGLKLQGWYLPSQRGSAVLLVHGWGQTRAALWPQAQLLAARGHGVLLFDLRAHGESEGPVSTLGDKERADVRAALAFLASQPDVRAGRIGALGFSIGASALAVVAAEDPRLKALVLESPYSTLEESERSDFHTFGFAGEWWGLRTFRQAGLDLPGVRPIDALPKLAGRRLLLIYGERETDPDMVRRMLAAAPAGAGTWTVPGATHGAYRETAGEAYGLKVVELFEPL